MNGKMNEDIKH